MDIKPKHWFVQLFIAVDQLLNVLVTPLTGGVWADETMSSRAYRMWVKGRLWGKFWMPVIDKLFFWQEVAPGLKGHCHQAYEREKKRTGLPPEMRG